MLHWGADSSGVIYADSSAALAIAKRKGAGNLRHINVSSLWIQGRQDRKEFEYRKVLGTENPADMMVLVWAWAEGTLAVRVWGRGLVSLDLRGKERLGAESDAERLTCEAGWGVPSPVNCPRVSKTTWAPGHGIRNVAYLSNARFG